MNVSPSKEIILKKIRKALTQSTPLPFPQSEGAGSVYQAPQEELAVTFAQRFSELQGKFAFSAEPSELVTQLYQLIASAGWQKIYCCDETLRKWFADQGLNIEYSDSLDDCDVAITDCEQLVARTGSIVMSAAQQSGRSSSVYAPVHICISRTSQLVFDIRDALLAITERYSGKLPSLITFATGPSRTADIEKTLVVGVHGPKEVYCFLLDE